MTAMRKVIRTIGTALLILGLFGTGTRLIDNWMEVEGARALRRALHTASAHCYAVEGRYPPDLAYLRRYYGIRTDKRRYTVIYRRTAPDRAPKIEVSSKEGGAMA